MRCFLLVFYLLQKIGNNNHTEKDIIINLFDKK